MNLVADENFPLESIQLLRANQYNVLSIAESFPGISDEQIIPLKFYPSPDYNLKMS